jgi:hypothetical protein
MPEHSLLVSARDAGRLGLRDGDQVKVTSASNPDGVWDLRNGSRKPMIRHVVLLATTTLGFPGMMAALTWVEDVLKS